MIPVYVNVFNRLTTTRQLVDQIAALDGCEPIIIDNDSTWGPLLDWYDTAPCEVIRLRSNLGHHAPWISGVIRQDAAPWYVVTDCDLDLSGVPVDLIERLREPFTWAGRKIIKSGIGLRIDDLPEWQEDARQWESQFWKRPVTPERRHYWAGVDTTLALYRGGTEERLAQAVWVKGNRATRTGGEYVARHVPWYTNGESLSDEDRNYFATSNGSNSWRPSGKGLRSVHQGR